MRQLILMIIAPRSITPYWLKSIIRRYIRKHYKVKVLFYNGGDVGGWSGWYEWCNMPVGFFDIDNNDSYKW